MWHHQAAPEQRGCYVAVHAHWLWRSQALVLVLPASIIIISSSNRMKVDYYYILTPRTCSCNETG